MAGRAAPVQAARGFTLVELLVVLIIIGVLAALGIPRLNQYFNIAKVDEAKPYLAAIAGGLQRYYSERRAYPSIVDGTPSTPGWIGNPVNDENDIMTELGVSLREAADFCFVVRADPGDWLWSEGALSTDGTIPEFEVWAILRDASGDTAIGTGGGNCTVQSGKLARATAWEASGTFSVGDVVALHYPPANSAGPVSGYIWESGFTTSDTTDGD